MAKYKICSVYDSKAECYGRPMFVPATGAAIRGFADEVNSGNKDSAAATHPEDFTLFEIGVWDDAAGTVEPYEIRKSLGNGVDFKRSE